MISLHRMASKIETADHEEIVDPEFGVIAFLSYICPFCGEVPCFECHETDCIVVS